jgi:hypothetical protein
MIRGVGPVYAKKLVRAFGEKVFDVIEAAPDRLREVDVLTCGDGRYGRGRPQVSLGLYRRGVPAISEIHRLWPQMWP